MGTITTCYGTYTDAAYSRLALAYDWEHGTILSFYDAAKLLGIERVLDIGANIGLYGIHLGGIDSVKRIDMFEPSPAAYDMINKNIALQQNADRFKAHNIAVSDVAGEARFHVVSPLAGNSHIVESGSSKPAISIQTHPIDALIRKKNTRFAVKIDVEGHELQVINGMRNLLAENSCIVQVECLTAEMRQAAEKLFAILGYTKVFTLKDDYIFLCEKFSPNFTDVQEIYFHHLRAELNSLMELRVARRSNMDLLMRFADAIMYKKDPLLPV
jgi:FkbM family methyltransferase